MNARSFSARQAIIFSSFSIIAGFARLLAIRAAAGDTAFEQYTLWLPLVLCLSESLNFFADTGRQSKVMLPRSAMNVIVIASAIAVVVCQGWFGLDVLVLVLYANLDSVLFVEVAKRSPLANTLLLIIRIAAVPMIFFNVPYGLAGISISALIVVVSYKVFHESDAKTTTLSNLNVVMATVCASRAREWLNTLIVQNILNQDSFFVFYLSAKILQNVSGLSYQTIRSTYVFNTGVVLQDLFRTVFRYDFLIMLFSISSLGVISGVGYFVYLFVVLVENLACQFFVFGYGIALKIMMCNLFGLASSSFAYVAMDLYTNINLAWALLVAGSIFNFYYLVLSSKSKLTNA